MIYILKMSHFRMLRGKFLAILVSKCNRASFHQDPAMHYKVLPLNVGRVNLRLIFTNDSRWFISLTVWSSNLANIYLFTFNNRNTRKRCEICSKVTIKTPERRQCRRSGVFIVNFEHISHHFLVCILLTLNKEM